MTHFSRITGTGSYLPPRRLSNADLVTQLAAQGVESSDDWIVERTGIRARHFADAGVFTSDLALQACRQALQAAGRSAADVDLIIVATSTPDMVFPSTACILQSKLGAAGGAAFDVQAVCSGFIYALTVADAMIRTGGARCALVVGAEIFSRILDFQDRTTCVLFGDGAGAVVLEASETPGILATDIHADGRHVDLLCVPGHVNGGLASGRPLLQMDGQAPSAVAGHSLGEYSALVAAGVLTLAQAVPLVRLRAQAMQDAVPVGVGAMAAILGMESQRVVAGCLEVSQTFAAGSGEVVEAVNFNDPAQTVIAGSRVAVDKACEWLKSQGAKRALPLPVSAPFHSSLMRPAAERLKQALAATALQAPSVALVNNVDVAVAETPDAIRDALFRQAFGAVRWVECVQAIQARGLQHIAECGPGKVLAGLCRRIDPALTALVVADPASLAETREALQ